jgi:excisionase family DNA binding protein
MEAAKLVRIEELCAELGPAVTVRTVRTLMAQRKIPYLKTGRRTVLFDLLAVRAALKRFTVEAIK